MRFWADSRSCGARWTSFGSAPGIDRYPGRDRAGGRECTIEAAVDGLRSAAAVSGGASRQQSVLNGWKRWPAQAPDLVAIHDAARPFVRAADIAACLAAAAADGVDGAVLGCRSPTR